MKFFVSILVLSLFFIFTPPGTASANDLKNLTFLLGKWRCEYNTETTNKGQKTNSQSKGVFKVSKILNGHWLKGEYTLSEKHPYKTLSHYGYNEKTKSYQMNFMDEWGTFGQAIAKDKSESVFRFEGESRYHEYTNRYVKEFTKISDREYKILLKLSNQMSQYFVTTHGVCKK